MGDPAIALQALAAVPTEISNTDIMGVLAYNNDQRSLEPHVYAPYGWGLNWRCDPGQCQAIGCLGAGYDRNNDKYVCDPRTGQPITRALFNTIYRHENERPLTQVEIDRLPQVDRMSHFDAINGVGPWLLTDGFYDDTGCCGTTGNCNQSCNGCGSCSTKSGRYQPNIFNVSIEKIRVDHPAFITDSPYRYAVSINGVQGRNIILRRGVRYYFYIKTNIAGVDNCDLPQEWMDTALLFSRQSISSSKAPRITNTIPMMTGSAYWLRVPNNWPGLSYMVANRDDVAGIGIAVADNAVSDN